MENIGSEISKDNQPEESPNKKEVKFVAMPIEVMNSVIALIGSEISWGKANPIMSKLETSCVPIDLKK